MQLPDKETIVELAAQGNVIPVCKEVLADTYTPVSAWLKLYKEASCSFLLESVEGGARIARYSMLGGNPFATFVADRDEWTIDDGRQHTGRGDPIAALRDYMRRFRPVSVQGVPRFCGGAVGCFSYDTVRLIEDIPDANEKRDPAHDIFFGVYKDVIVFDRFRHRMMLIANIILSGGDDTQRIHAQYDEACARIAAMERALRAPLPYTDFRVCNAHEPQSDFTRKEYEEAVRTCKEYIRRGDIFQIVLSQRFQVRVEADAFDIYRSLRTLNPSPYMYYLRHHDIEVVGASPEMLVRVEQGYVHTCPIAGTLPRGSNEQEDERQQAALKNDPKERAEHVMLVDLGRNDLGRVCRYGSVEVTDCMRIERFSHVMHMVSDVCGRLNDDCDALDALYACFPAGTLSGAPKIRAMEIIDELEKVKRGIYGGALGYIDFSGAMDTCIVIRTLLFSRDVAYIQAGAGIVADSVPEKEYHETINKAMALFRAITQGEEISARHRGVCV